jgi:uncharacterized protein with GYD domain
MPTYITLLHFTQKGVGTIKEGPDRLDRARQAFKAAGADPQDVLPGHGPLRRGGRHRRAQR